jgi:hypothetical protein
MSAAPTRGCGCLGCTADAIAVINHAEHGRRTVCADDINGHDILEWLVDPDATDVDTEVVADD